MFVVVLFAVSEFFAFCQAQQFLLIHTENGQIRGRIVEVENSRRFGVFLGVRFAQPQVGQLRFARPEPVQSWSPTVFDAAGNFSNMCPQGRGYNPASQNEDCLFLNILTPKTRAGDSTTYPVFFWLHGGGFETGSAQQIGLEGALRNLVSRGIVVVAAQYRLGAFGFWNLRSSVAPGNMAFWDQIAALKWTRENIRAFGGNPDQVTLAGDAAGAGSLQLLSVSPKARGLFKQAIVMSGSAFVPWAERADSVPANPSKDLATNLGCMTQDQQETLECMRSKSTAEIMAAAEVRIGTPGTGWAARIDGEILPDTIEKLVVNSSPMNFLIGTTNHEWAYVDITVKGNPFSTKSEFKNAVDQSVNPYLFTNYLSIRAVAKFYYSPPYLQTEISNNNSVRENVFWFDQENNFKSGLRFWSPAVDGAIKYTRAGGRVFLYSWDYISAGMFNGKPWRGAVHGADLTYLFGKRYTPYEFAQKPNLNMLAPISWSREDSAVEDTIVPLWTNFIKFGHPTPRPVNGIVWTEYRPETDNYLSIDSPRTTMKNGYHVKDVELWNQVVPQLNNQQMCLSSGVESIYPRCFFLLMMMLAILILVMRLSQLS